MGHIGFTITNIICLHSLEKVNLEKVKVMESDFIKETEKFLKECGRTAYDVAKEAGINPVLLNSYMSDRIANKSKVENMRLKIFVRLWPIVEKWKQEKEKNDGIKH